MPKHYGGFLWTNCDFILLSDYTSANCQNAFKPGQQCVAYTNLRNYQSYQQFGNVQTSISILEKGQTFNVESIEALSVTNDKPYDAHINGMRNNQTCFTRQIKLHNELQLITLNWINIDKLTIVAFNQCFALAISQISFILP